MPNDIRVNGATEPLIDGTVANLLRRKGVTPGACGIAVALDGAVLPARAWDSATLKPGDTVEIVRAFQGG